MTNKEAKEIMSKVTFYWELGEQTLTQNQINEALNLAINALEQESVLDKIKAEIEQDAFKGVDGVKYTYIPRVNRIIDKYKAESEGNT